MAYSVMQVSKITSAQLANYVGSEGMIVINSDTDSIVVLDGQTPGGSDVPTEQDLQTYVNTQVSTITAAGGQILPPTNVATTDGSVIVWDGGDWQEDSRFAFTTYVDSQISALAPPTGQSVAGQALQWSVDPNTGIGKLVNYTLPVSGGGGGITVSISSTQSGEVLYWDGAAFQNDLALNRGIAPKPSTISTATDVLQWDGSAFQQKSLNAYAVKPTGISTSGTALTWDGSSLQHTSDFSIKPSVTSLADEVLAWDQTLNSNKGGFVQKDLSSLALDSDVLLKADIGSASTFTDLGLVEAELATKAPEPPSGIAAGEFLRWDETGKQFTFATPAGGGGSSSIPTPTLTTDYATGTEVLIWDNSAGDLKNVTSPFAITPPASGTGEYLRWDASLNAGAGDWVNDTPAGGGGSSGSPASSTTANQAVTWDGVSSFVNTGGYAMLTDLASKAKAPTVQTASNEVVKWNNTTKEFENATLSSVGFTSTGSITPPTDTPAGEYLAWNGTSGIFENRSDLATASMVSNLLPAASDPTLNREVIKWDGSKFINVDIAPSAASTTNEVIKWNGNSFENITLSSAGYSNMGGITPPTNSGSTDVLQWDGSDFINVSGFASIGGASSNYDTLGKIETQMGLISAGAATGIFDIAYDSTHDEYVLTVKASAIAAA